MEDSPSSCQFLIRTVPEYIQYSSLPLYSIQCDCQLGPEKESIAGFIVCHWYYSVGFEAHVQDLWWRMSPEDRTSLRLLLIGVTFRIRESWRVRGCNLGIRALASSNTSVQSRFEAFNFEPTARIMTTFIFHNNTGIKRASLRSTQLATTLIVESSPSGEEQRRQVRPKT